MKKISLALITAMAAAMLSSTASAETVNTYGMTESGLKTYVNDFQDCTVNSTYTNKTNGIEYNAGGAAYKIRGNNSNYLEIQQNTTGKYSDLRVNLFKAEEPAANAIADAKRYNVKFRMRISPGEANKGVYMFLGGLWYFNVNSSGKTYGIKCNNGAVTAVDGASTTYNCKLDVSDTATNKFHDYEIDVDKENKTATLKIDQNVIFENVPQYNDTSYDSLYIKYNKLKGYIGIDDITVTVTDDSLCGNENWETDTDMDFEDFTVGKIPASESGNVGGFVNDKVDNADSFFSYINYSYDSANPAQINKFLTITKEQTGYYASIKRDISSAVANYSEYEISFKVKNELDASTSVALIKDGDGSSAANGTVVKFTTLGTASYFDYSTGSGVETKIDTTVFPKAVFTPGEWVDVKFRVNKNTNKSDIYIGDMETPVATGVTSNYKYDGGTFVNSPQKSATGSVSLDDIVITPVAEDDYVFTYVTGCADKSRFIDGKITAECKISENVKKNPLVLIGEFNAAGELVNVAVSDALNPDTGTIKAELSGVTAEENKSVKIMLWDGETFAPVKKCVTLSPQITQ